MDGEELIEILNRSRDYNQEKRITGMLVYCEGSFMQLLEGEKQDVLRLFEKIAADKRHSGLFKILEGDISQRSFRGSPMGFRSVGRDSLKEITGYRSLLELIASVNYGEGSNPCLVFMKSFMQMNYPLYRRETVKRISPF